MGLNHAQAEDCVQESAEKLAQMHTISYIEQKRVKNLFCTVALNHARDMVRRMKSISKGVDSFGVDQLIEDSQASRMSRKERETIISLTVHRALAKLTDIESYVAWRYYAMEMSLREIVEDLFKDKGLKWSHVRLMRFIRKIVKPKLKEKLKEIGGDKL
jgi:RNA polymerase sigma factor (sigma-70 family)